MPKRAPYGTWSSPISASAIARVSASLDDVIVDPVTSTIYHIERRPSEGGRNVLVKTEDGVDVISKEHNCRTGVQEYGGAAAVVYDGTTVFSNFSDGRVYTARNGDQPQAVTPENTCLRYAAFAVHPGASHLVVAVQEDHTNPAPADVVTTLCLINTKAKSVRQLLHGADFYAYPTFSPDGTRISWQQWFHPDMPWTGAQVVVAEVSLDGDGLQLHDVRSIAGKSGTTSAGFPMWSSNDILVYTSDNSGYQNPRVYEISTSRSAPVLQELVREDFSLPAWILSFSFGAPLDKAGRAVLYTALRDGRSILYVATLCSGAMTEVECPYLAVECIRPVTDHSVVFIGSKSDEGRRLVLCNLEDWKKPSFTVLKDLSSGAEIPSAYFSQPQPMSLKVPPKDELLHVVYYPPTNPDYTGPESDIDIPPCVVSVHGGPTAHASQALNLTTQFFTSRGWGWLDVNYRGSCGYGREYIDRLDGQMGLIDVEDCAIAVSILASERLIDPRRVAIRGGSSGGYTALAALCSFPDSFAAGASLYGISDLKKLDDFTHKFESHYLEKLLGGTSEAVPQVYYDRSPVNQADKIKVPLLILQGLLDAVVPPEQAETIVKKIREKDGRVEYHTFEGEGHGWRKAETIEKALLVELAFYSDVFGLKV